jgi:hypothetical protein
MHETKNSLKEGHTLYHSIRLDELNRLVPFLAWSERVDFFSILRKFFNFLYLENFWSKSRPSRIRLKVVPFDAAWRDESIGVTYDPIWENFLFCAWNPLARLWSSMKLIVFNGVHARNKKFSQRGAYVIPFDSSRRAALNDTTFSEIRGGRIFSKIF